MKAKEKAAQLRYKYSTLLDLKTTDGLVLQCVLIAVDEIMKAPHQNSYIELIPEEADTTDWFWDKFDEYWNEVKQEIYKL